ELDDDTEDEDDLVDDEDLDDDDEDLDLDDDLDLEESESESDDENADSGVDTDNAEVHGGSPVPIETASAFGRPRRRRAAGRPTHVDGGRLTTGGGSATPAVTQPCCHCAAIQASYNPALGRAGQNGRRIRARPPRPIEVRQEQIPSQPRGTFRTTRHDPEDEG